MLVKPPSSYKLKPYLRRLLVNRDRFFKKGVGCSVINENDEGTAGPQDGSVEAPHRAGAPEPPPRCPPPKRRKFVELCMRSEYFTGRGGFFSLITMRTNRARQGFPNPELFLADGFVKWVRQSVRDDTAVQDMIANLATNPPPVFNMEQGWTYTVLRLRNNQDDYVCAFCGHSGCQADQCRHRVKHDWKWTFDGQRVPGDGVEPEDSDISRKGSEFVDELKRYITNRAGQEKDSEDQRWRMMMWADVLGLLDETWIKEFTISYRLCCWIYAHFPDFCPGWTPLPMNEMPMYERPKSWENVCEIPCIGWNPVLPNDPRRVFNASNDEMWHEYAPAMGYHMRAVHWNREGLPEGSHGRYPIARN